MSQSKFVMAKKLSKVQTALMQEEISETSYDVLLPLIFKKCYENNLTFWFNFMEDSAVLNLRDVEHENYELNIRHYYANAPLSQENIDAIKLNLLVNAFLVINRKVVIDLPVKSEVNENQKKGKKTQPKKEVKHEKPIKQSNAVPPTSIRTVIDMLEKNGEPVTRKSIQKYLQLDKMSTDNRRRCIAYLKSMEE